MQNFSMGNVRGSAAMRNYMRVFRKKRRSYLGGAGLLPRPLCTQSSVWLRVTH